LCKIAVLVVTASQRVDDAVAMDARGTGRTEAPLGKKNEKKQAG
jgi:hypothetical protein